VGKHILHKGNEGSAKMLCINCLVTLASLLVVWVTELHKLYFSHVDTKGTQLCKLVTSQSPWGTNRVTQQFPAKNGGTQHVLWGTQTRVYKEGPSQSVRAVRDRQSVRAVS